MSSMKEEGKKYISGSNFKYISKAHNLNFLSCINIQAIYKPHFLPPIKNTQSTSGSDYTTDYNTDDHYF
jgi:hypothetical protein